MNEKATQRVQKRYDRIAKFYDGFESLVEKRFFGKFRANTFNKLEGKILEVGVGTGKNLRYYNKRAKVTGIDISQNMLKRAVQKNKDLGLNAKLYQMDAQKMKFKSNTFDYVVSSFVFCSIPEPIQALKEVKRVMKKGGTAIFIEHVLSKYKLIALLEHIHNPLTSRLFGFNVNRNTRKNIEEANLKIVKDKNLAFFDVFRKFTCVK
ncbi:MAG: class I SAM-dependent methyltransferase [Candidatus Altiarchaeota archaeon]|nr:class I SAM-dependent methyltransferase [Candidatus Altiarchaeota archaeon]